MMDATQGYAVFFHEQALEVLGEAIKPYLVDGPAGVHVLCVEIDTGGSLVEMTLAEHTVDGQRVEMELMVPSNMVRMIVSARSDGAFGFGRRDGKAATMPSMFPKPSGPSPATTVNTTTVVPVAATTPQAPGDPA